MSGSEVGCGWRVGVGQWANMYSLLIGECRDMYRDGLLWVAIYSMCGWSCVFYRYYKAWVVLYSMDMSRLAIYRVGGVGDMRHIKRGWGQHGSCLWVHSEGLCMLDVRLCRCC